MIVLAEVHLIVVATHAEAQSWRLVEASGDKDAEKKVRAHFDAMPGIKIISIFIHKPIT